MVNNQCVPISKKLKKRFAKQNIKRNVEIVLWHKDKAGQRHERITRWTRYEAKKIIRNIRNQQLRDNNEGII